MNENPYHVRYPGPSQHFLMSGPDRIALYRRVIGFLAFYEYKSHTLTARMRWEYQSALAEAQSINHDEDRDPHRQLHLLRVLLAEQLALLPPEDRYETAHTPDTRVDGGDPYRRTGRFAIRERNGRVTGQGDFFTGPGRTGRRP